MDSLSDLINNLDTTEIKEFKSFLKKKNKRNDVKNIQLLNYLKTDDINNKNIFKLETKISNDAYHALRKRLSDALILFLSNKTFEKNNAEGNEALRLLIVSRYFFENEWNKIAYKCLQKAEKFAQKLEQYSLLNEIYLTRLQYAHLNPAEDLNKLTIEFEFNQKQIQNEAKLNVIYALLRKEFQEIQLKGKITNLNDLLTSTLRQFNYSLEDILTYKTLFQILFIANEYASIKQNYQLIESFIKTAQQFIESKKETAGNHLFYHIHIIYFLANYSFRSQKFDECKTYLDEMLVLMQKQNNIYYSVYNPRYQLLVSLLFHFTNNSLLAIKTIENTLKTNHKNTKQEDIDDLVATQAMILGQLLDKNALKTIAKLSHTDAWYEKKMGMLWTIRKNMMEILIHAQFEHTDYALSRIKSFKRRYKNYLHQSKEQIVMDYILIIEKYLLKPEIIRHHSFNEKLNHLIQNEQKGDIFLKSFLGWMIAIQQNISPYEATMKLINNED